MRRSYRPSPRSYRPCPHERLSRYKSSENLVGLIVAVIGPTSPGKTALAREIAKSLRCTFLQHNPLRSCFPPGDGSAWTDDPAYQILWKMIQRHLDRRNHHIVVDYPLSHRVELDRLLGIAESHDAVVILIDCQPGQRHEVRRDDRDGEAVLAQDLERSVKIDAEQVDDRFYDYDPTEINVPKLVMGDTCYAELEEKVESVKKLILASLDEKFTIGEGDDTIRSGCSRCALDAVRRRFASFPKTFKHKFHDDEFRLFYHGDAMRKGSTFSYICRACCRSGENLCYTWRKLYFHPECVLELPLEVNHKCHWDPLKLTLLPPKDDTDEYYCEVCAKRRDADNWIYYCQGCEYEAHVPCVIPNLPGQRRNSPPKEDDNEAEKGEQASSEEESSVQAGWDSD